MPSPVIAIADTTTRSRETAETVSRIQRGDVAAFDTLFRLHAPGLLAFAESYGHIDPDVAEDVVCDVFGWLWRHREHWQPQTSIEAYLYGAVRNKLYNRSRDLRREALRRTTYQHMDQLPGLGQQTPAVDVTLESREEHSTLRQVIQELPEPQRTIILLRWTKQWDWQEVAEVIGLTVGAAKMHHVRALKTLRQRLTEYWAHGHHPDR